MTTLNITAKDSDTKGLYRLLPSVSELLRTPPFTTMLESHSHDAVVECLRLAMERLRDEVALGEHTEASLTERISCLDIDTAERLLHVSNYSLKRVINATGVVLHTNLGRSPLGKSALDHIIQIAGGFCNLELDLESGQRSRRDVHVDGLLLRLLAAKTGAQGEGLARQALVVNNCAAATFLALNSLAEGTEVIVSRGELVEIGGGFRIPEILAKSGARLREVGTTNRTRLSDYESAITPETGLVLRVHQSNFSIEGFTERPALTDLAALCQSRSIPLFDDQGTGLLEPLDELGVRGEPTLPGSLHARCDLVAASGDKLLGGPQCGLLVGRADLVERVRGNPLFRAFRVDKLTYAALEATLIDYKLGRQGLAPVMRMLKISARELSRRCERVIEQIDIEELRAEVVPTLSLIGGGTAPSARLASRAIALSHAVIEPHELLFALRKLDPPVIARIDEDRVILDLRTVEPEFDVSLPSLLKRALAPKPVDRTRIR